LGFSRLSRPPAPPLVPYTTLFRSHPTVHLWERAAALSDKRRSFHPGQSSRREHRLQWTYCRWSYGLPSITVRWLHHDIPARSLRSEEHTSELQSRFDLVCRLLLEK